MNDILTLYARVTQKTLLISKTFGIEGKKLLKPDDDYEALQEFNQAYEGTTSAVEEMHLEYQRLLDEIPGLGEMLERLPGGVFSGKQRPARGSEGRSSATRSRRSTRSSESSRRRRARPAGTSTTRSEARFSRSRPRSSTRSARLPDTPRVCSTEEQDLLTMRDSVLKHIKNGYLKRVDAPVGVTPRLRCWMELNDG